MIKVPPPKLRRVRGISPAHERKIKKRELKISDPETHPENAEISPYREGTNEYLTELGFKNERNRLFERYGKENVKVAARIFYDSVKKNGGSETTRTDIAYICEIVEQMGRFVAHHLIVSGRHSPMYVAANFRSETNGKINVVFPIKPANSLEEMLRQETNGAKPPELSVTYKRPEVIVLDYVRR